MPTARCNKGRTRTPTLRSCGRNFARRCATGLPSCPRGTTRDQWLLRLRADDPPKSYHEISELLGMAVGSVGPTLRRSLDRLRETSAVRAYLAAAPTAGGGTGGDQRELAEVE